MIRSLEPPKTWIPKISFAPNNLSEVAGQKYWQRVVAATSSQGLLMNHNTKDRHEVPPSVHVSQFGSSDIMTATPSENVYQEYSQRFLSVITNQRLIKRPPIQKFPAKNTLS